MEIHLVDASRQIVQPFGQHVVDRAMFQRIDLARDIGEMVDKFRLRRRLLRAFHQIGELIQALFQAGGRLGAAELVDAHGQRFEAAGKIVGRLAARRIAVHHINLVGESADAAFDPLHGLIVRLHHAAEAFHGCGDRQQLVFKRMHGGAVAEAAQMLLDIVQAIGE